MNQVKKYLELYVQWLALGLGAAFLLWMVYGYVVTKPVTAAVGPNNPAASPGEIDTLIWDEKGKALQDQVTSTTIPPNMPKVSDMVAQIRSQLDVTNSYAMAGPYTPLTPQIDINIREVSKDPTGQQITKLPVLPPITNLLVSGGHSNVTVTPPAGQQPAADAGSTTPAAIDKIWRSIMGRMPVADLDKAFKDAKIPQALYNTAVLRVELVREEQDDTGKWGPDLVVPSLPINPVSPLPDGDATISAQNDFQQWAETNYTLVMQPPFYTVLHGDIWYVPGTKNPNEVQVQMVAFDPAAFAAANGDPDTLLPEDRKIWDAYKEKLRQEAAAARRAASASHNPTQNPNFPPAQNPNSNGNNNGTGRSTGGGRSGGGGGGGGRRGLADDPDRPPLPPGFQSGAPGPLMPPGAFPNQPPDRTRPTPDGSAATAAAATLPKGAFDPGKQGDILVWAHDDTVQAGKTYRYKLRYYIVNPVAHSTGLTSAAFAKQFYIASADSDWTPPQSVESDTNFYVVNTTARNEVSFDVFHWKDGLWQKQTVKVSPGDMVGGPDPVSKVDFTTGWTLIDVRTDQRDDTVKTILLASNNGTVLKKEKNIDMHDRKYHELLDDVKLHEKDVPKTASALP